MRKPTEAGKRNLKIHFRVSEKEKKVITDTMKSKKINLSELLRKYVMQFCRAKEFE